MAERPGRPRKSQDSGAGNGGNAASGTATADRFAALADATRRRLLRHRYYRLRPAALTELRDWLDELERFWQARLAALGDYLREAPR